MNWSLVLPTSIVEQFSKEYSSLRPESSENNTLGSQVLDLNFGKQNCTRNPNMGSKQYFFCYYNRTLGFSEPETCDFQKGKVTCEKMKHFSTFW